MRKRKKSLFILLIALVFMNASIAMAFDVFEPQEDAGWHDDCEGLVNIGTIAEPEWIYAQVKCGLFMGAAFDGRYVYSYSGPKRYLIRYDTHGAFNDINSWEKYSMDNVATGGGFFSIYYLNEKIYLSPDPGWSTWVMYDVNKPFNSNTSYHVYNYSDAGINGIRGVCSDGKYLYGTPFYNDYVVRVDTSNFSDNGSWSMADVRDMNAIAVSGPTDDSCLACTDGDDCENTCYLRLTDANVRKCTSCTNDSTEETCNNTCTLWERPACPACTGNPSEETCQESCPQWVLPAGFLGCTFADNSLVLTPYGSGSNSFVRYDKNVFKALNKFTITTAGLWSEYDAHDIYDAANPYNLFEDVEGYHQGCEAGVYVYYAPYGTTAYGSGNNYTHGKLLRRDKRLEFDNPKAWEAFDLEGDDNSPRKDWEGFWDCTYDRKNHIYLTPHATDNGWGAEVVVYNITKPFYEIGSYKSISIGNILAPYASEVRYTGSVYANGYIYMFGNGGGKGFNGRVVRLSESDLSP